MRIPSQHLPIPVARNESYLFDRKTCFKKTTGAFMPEIMKMKIVDLQVSALATKGRADRSGVVREDAAASVFINLALLLNDGEGIVPTDIKERNALVVSVFASRILTVSD